jgi:hypothetical protein
VKALDINGPAFSFLCEKFPAGVFISSQILQLFRDHQFDLVLSNNEKAAWNAFQLVATGFLGNIKAVNFRKILEDLITCYEKLRCNMSLKMHFLH